MKKFLVPLHILIGVVVMTGCRTPRLPEVPVIPPPIDQAPIEPPVIIEPAVPEFSFTDVAVLQITLDRAGFSPGVIDGIIGSRTRTALRAWQEDQGLAGTGKMDESTRERLVPVEQAFTMYRVTEEDYAALGVAPTSWRERAKADSLPYETILETIAEKHHASERAIRTLNPDIDWPDPPVGTEVVVPKPGKIRLPRADSIHISLGDKTVRIYGAGNNLVALFPCSIGRSTMESPVGEMSVVNAAENPEYYFDPAVFPENEEAQTITGKLVIPPGPNNPVGVAWISLSRPGYGIHGTPHPEDIGKTESHGCIRLANWNARRLLRMISIGTPVIIEE